MIERHEIDLTMPDEMLMALYAPSGTADMINDDPDWLRARVLLGALFRKYGGFELEIKKKMIRVFQGARNGDDHDHHL